MARGLVKRKKVKKQFSRRLQSGWAGCPTESFWIFKDHARTDLDKKEIGKTIKTWAKENYKKEYKTLQQAPDWCFTMPYYLAASIEWLKLGHKLPENWNFENCVKRWVNETHVVAKRAIEAKSDDASADKVKIKKRTIADIVKDRTSDFIAEVEGAIDSYHDDKLNGKHHTKATHDLMMDYSVYNELQKVDAPYNMAKGVYDYYLPYKGELEELVNKCPSDLNEAYSNMTKIQRKRYLEFISQIVDDAEKYMMTKKAVRKTRAPVAKTADKQIKSLKFLKDSSEHKLASINPILIVGAHRLYTFNAKSRVLTEYVCKSAKGFEIKGSTLQYVDEISSRETKLRKPEEFIPIVMKQLPSKVNVAWKELTTKTNVPNARINKDTLLLRVLDK